MPFNEENSKVLNPMVSDFNFFDSHAHLSIPDVYKDIDSLLQKAQENHVRAIINICIDQTSLENGIKLNQKYPFVFNAGAITPHDVQALGEKEFSFFEKCAKNEQLIAIGETGLDYYYEHSPMAMQRRFLIKHLHLADELDLPVIFHCREAFSDLFAIADQEYPKQKKAVLHCFTGNMEEARQVIKRGWYLSLSGIVTFKKSRELREVAKMVPKKQLLIETDSPYLAPQNKRGKPNEPSYIVETAQVIAHEKNMSLKELAKCTFDNACKCFSVNP